VCGEKTIHACPECKQEIRGAKIYDYPNPFSERTPIPEYCHNCGASFPWIIDKIKNKDICTNCEF
jgi:hypothetical protein